MGMCCSSGMNPAAQLKSTKSTHILRDIESKSKFEFRYFGEISSQAPNLAHGNVLFGWYESWCSAQVDTIRSSSAGLQRPPLG